MEFKVSKLLGFDTFFDSSRIFGGLISGSMEIFHLPDEVSMVSGVGDEKYLNSNKFRAYIRHKMSHITIMCDIFFSYELAYTISINKASVKEKFMDLINSKLKDVSRIWLEIAESKVKETTFERYSIILANHIVPHFGERIVSEITDNELSSFIKDIKSKYKTNTANAIIGMLKRLIKYAYGKREMEFSVFEGAYDKAQSRRHKTLSIVESKMLNQSLLQNLSLEKLGCIIALNMGLRLGEICALRWEDVDFTRNSITINKTVQRVKAKSGNTKTTLRISTPKTACSNREVAIPRFIVQILKELYIKNKTDIYIVSSKPNKPLDPRQLSRIFAKECEKAVGRKIKFHELRHTFATLSILNGVDPKTVSLILGHSNVSITLDIYTDIYFEDKAKGIHTLENLIGG